MNDEPPQRVIDAEERARFRELLSQTSLGTADVEKIYARLRHYMSALPERWVSMPIAELERLLGLYRDRRETWNETHDAAVEYVLTEVDYEPSQHDLAQLDKM
jgi:hypothetical protein